MGGIGITIPPVVDGVEGLCTDGERDIGGAPRGIDGDRFREMDGEVQVGSLFVRGVGGHIHRSDGGCGGIDMDIAGIAYTVQGGGQGVAGRILQGTAVGGEGGTDLDAIGVIISGTDRIPKQVSGIGITIAPVVGGVEGLCTDGERDIGGAPRGIDGDRFREMDGEVQVGSLFVRGVGGHIHRSDGGCRGIDRDAAGIAYAVQGGGQLVARAILEGATAWGDGRPDTDAIGVGFVGLNRITEEMGGGRCAVDAVVEGVNRRPVQIQ